MRQRLNVRSVDRYEWIEEECQPEPLSFRGQPEKSTVGGEAQGASLLHQLEGAFLVAKDELGGRLAFGIDEGDFQGLVAIHFGVADGDEAVRHQAIHHAVYSA